MSTATATTMFQQQHQMMPSTMDLAGHHPQQQQCCACISSEETSSQIRNSDVARIAFYLRCCVVGCGLSPNNHATPLELITNFVQARHLPLEYQNMMYKLAFEDFSLANLLGRVLHVDTHKQILPDGVSTMFLRPNTSEYILAMNHLGVYDADLRVPSFYTGNVIICSFEWIQTYHIGPFQRYMTMGNRSSQIHNNNTEYIGGGTVSSIEEALVQQEQDVLISLKKVDTNSNHNAKCNYSHNHDQDLIRMEEDIPMATAIPLSDGSSSPSRINMNDEDDSIDDVSTSLIVPGQHVRLFGLETEEMNDVVGVVQERKDNRIIVNVPNHSCKYSVRIENLMIIIQEATAVVV